MRANRLFKQFRKHGSSAKEAATLTGYAFLIQQGDCAHLKISGRQEKEIKRAFRKLERHQDDLVPLSEISNGHKRDGVVSSGYL